MTPIDRRIADEIALIDVLKGQAKKLTKLKAVSGATGDTKSVATIDKVITKTTKAINKAAETRNTEKAYLAYMKRVSDVASNKPKPQVPKTIQKLVASHGSKPKTGVIASVSKNIKQKITTTSHGTKPQIPKPTGQNVGMSNLELLAIAAVVFTGTTASIVLYKRFLSKSARACKGRKGLDRENCVIKFRIAGYEASIKSLQSSFRDCSQTSDPFKCKSKMQDRLLLYSAKIRKLKKKLNEGKSMNFINGYLEYLNEDRGMNLPIERDNKPNYIRICMMQEDDRVKIRCLRKLKELTAMNPFYQYRIDRFVDAITNTYEPTREPGFNEYKND